MMDETIIPLSSGQMIYGYVQLKRKKHAEAYDLIQHFGKQLEPHNSPLPLLSSWLWLLGEYTVQAKDNRLAEKYKTQIHNIILLIANDWAKPAPHWIYKHRAGVYLSQVALHYAALRSASFMLLSDTALRTCKEMREQLFSSFMKDTAMVSELGSSDVKADIVLAAVPFGFFTPGDLALLKGLQALDEAALTAMEASFLSWYYAECGNSVKAKQLGEQAARGEAASGSADKWVESALLMLQLHEANEAGIVFDHMPVGSECPYFTDDNERSPRIVLEAEEVTINVRIRGTEQIEQVNLWAACGASDPASVTMKIISDTGKEPYWQAVIPARPAGSTVSYYFVAISSGNEYVSANYKYEIYRWEKLIPVDSVIGRPGCLQYRTEEGQGALYTLTVDHSSGTGDKCRLSWGTDSSADASKDGHEDSSEQGSVDSSTEENGSKEADDADTNPRIFQHELPLSGQLPTLHVLLSASGELAKVKLGYRIDEQARWYAMGERFSRLTFERQELDNYVYNQYKDQGFRTYIPVPFAMGTDGYGIFLESSLYSIFRFGTTEPNTLEIIADVNSAQGGLAWHQLNGEPLDQLRQYTAITGLPALPPKWAFGPWMSSNNWDSDKETRHQLDQNIRYGIPATVIVLEQWSDEATFYIFNDSQYETKAGAERFTYGDFTFPTWGRWPDPKGLVERIHQDGLKLLLWQAPVMKYMEGLVHQQHDIDEEMMIKHGYMVKQEDGSPYRIPSFEWFRGSLVPDFTSDEASEWWLSKRQYLLDELGIDGFKTDGGECIYGSHTRFHDGRTGASMRNEYSNTYIRAFHSFANRFVSGGAITFSRSGYTGAQNTPMHWAGDEKSTFEAFRSSIIAGLSSGLSGISFWGWDLGGFSGEIPTAELFIRSTQMAAFCPVMQYHAESKGQFNMDRTPWNIAERTNTPEVLSIYKKYADLRMNLLPYIYEQALYSAATGEPLMRAMVLDYNDDPIASSLETQYMFGKSLLVAPILEEGARSVHMYFPMGCWAPLFEEHAKGVSGGRFLTVPAALEHIPVYVKENSVLPFNISKELTLASHVGNQVEGYAELALLAYITGNMTYQFNDLPHVKIALSITKTKGEMTIHAEVEGSELEPVLWLKQMEGHPLVMRDNQVLQEAASEHELTAANILRRGSDLLLRLKSGSQVIRMTDI